MNLSLRGLTVRLDGRAVLDDISLEIASGQVVAVLGPTEAGKTALLETIAGLLRPEQGRVLVGDLDITEIRPEQRHIGLMLQLPNLVPQRRLLNELSRASRLRPKAARLQGRGMLDAFGLGGFAQQPVSTLSLGDRERAELARALVDRPGVALLDDPLTAQPPGDRLALLALARRYAETLLIATHDHLTALAGADRIAVLRDGRLLQFGTPAEIYDTPCSAFVARFVGGANVLRGVVREVRPGRLVVVVEGVRLLHAATRDKQRSPLGEPLVLSLRPERVGLLQGGEVADNTIEGSVVSVTYQGATSDVTVRTVLGGVRVRLASWRSATVPMAGATVRLGWAADAATPVAED